VAVRSQGLPTLLTVGRPARQSHAQRPRTDRQCWAKLRAVLAERPATHPADDDSLWAARATIALTVADVDAFIDHLSARLPEDTQPVSGSSLAIAWSLVRICRAFTRNWADAASATPSRVAEFNRDVELLRTILGEQRAQAASQA